MDAGIVIPIPVSFQPEMKRGGTVPPMSAQSKEQYMAAKQTDSKDKESLTVISPSGIVCFPHVWEPFAFKAPDGKQKEPAYRLLLVFDSDTDLKEMRQTAGRALIKKWGKEEAAKLLKKNKLNLPFRDAEEYEQYGEPFVEGSTFISVSSTNPPGVVDARAKPIMKQQDFYAGCLARVSVYAHAYDSLGNMGVTFLLNNIQKTGDGEKISGRMDAADEFGAVEGADSSSSNDDLDDLF